MIINKLTGINSIQGLSNVNPASPVKTTGTADSVQISQDAIAMNELYELTQLVKAAPDVRRDRIDQVLEAMKDPNYFNNEKLAAVAEKMVSDLFA